MFAGTEPFPESSVLVSAHGSAQEVQLQCFVPVSPDIDFCETDLKCGARRQVCDQGEAKCVQGEAKCGARRQVLVIRHIC